MLEILCYVLVFLAEGITAWLFIDQVNARKTKFHTLLVVYVAVYSILFFISQIGVVWLNGISFVLLNAIILFSNYRTKFLPGIIQVFFLSGVLYASEILVGLALATISKDFTSYTYDLPYTVAMTVTARLLFFLIMQLSVKLFRPHSSDENNYSFFLLSLIPISSVVMSIALSYVCLTISLVGIIGVCVIICTLTLLLINFSVTFIYRQIHKSNEERLEYELRLQKELANADYYEMMREQYDNQRLLIHDIKRHISVIDGLIEEKQYDNVKSYLHEISGMPALNRIRYCDNSILNSILGRYTSLCQKNGIILTHEIHNNVVDDISDTDITTIFDNLIANSFEASRSSSEKMIDVFVIKEDNAIIIKILNSCDTKPSLSKSGLPVSTKPETNRHGLGLQSVIRTAKKYGGTYSIDYDEESRQFAFILTLFTTAE